MTFTGWPIWFAQCGIGTVVIESAGVFWIPVFEILE
jgi:transposase